MEVIDDVKQVISKSLKIPIGQLKDDSKLEDLGAESLDVIEIIFDLEEKFDIDITVKVNSKDAMTVKTGAAGGPESEITFSTIGDIAEAIKRLMAEKKTA